MNYFEARLAHETDCADVAHGPRDFALLDARSERAYDNAHLPGAISLAKAGWDALPDGPLVVYCWGPACNAATKACARLAAEGRDVKEMLGGFEYWVREGFTVEGLQAERHGGDPSGLVGVVE